MKLEENRDMHEKILKRELSKPEEHVVQANFIIQHIISELLCKYENYRRSAKDIKCDAILQIGTGFFYEILNRINENIEDCPITQELCRDSISRLGVRILSFFYVA